VDGDAIAIAAAVGVLGLLAGIALARRHVVANDDGSALRGQLEVQAAELRRLNDRAAERDLSAEQLRQGLDGTRRALDELRVRDEERRLAETEQHEVVRRLATVLAGGAAKGRPGEHVLREQLAALPPSMLTSDFRVRGKVVEFGLVLPDGRRLPIDSKWAALAELEALEAATDPVERDACARAVEKVVLGRVKEVAQYLDPSVTSSVAVAAIPDAAYAALRRAHVDAYARGVVVVPYGSALPIVLFLYSLVQRYGDAVDVHATLAEIGGVLDALEGVVENRFVRAATLVTNGADEFRSQLGKARGSLARAHAVVEEPDDDDGAPSLQVIG
jgi:hypothetical protein